MHNHYTEGGAKKKGAKQVSKMKKEEKRIASKRCPTSAAMAAVARREWMATSIEKHCSI